MIDRDQLRAKKQGECYERIEKLHEEFPRLGEIAERIGLLSLERIRVGVLQKNPQRAAKIDMEVAALMQEKRHILTESHLSETIYQPSWDCPHCEDKGYTAPGVLCRCFIQERLDDAFRHSGIPESMRHYTLDQFDTSYYLDATYVRDKLQKCRHFLELLIKRESDGNILLLGDVGRGKTYLSIAIANEALAAGCTVIYKRVDDLLDLIRECKFDRDSSKDKAEMFELEQLKTCDLLVIDDLGAETVSSFGIGQLRMIIEERNVRNKAWIINSNLNLDELQAVYGQRVSDRLVEKASIYRLESENSIRIMKRMREIN